MEVNDILSENEDSAFDSPKELTSRNPPFDIQLTFSRYRAGKEYESKLHIKVQCTKEFCTATFCFIVRPKSGYGIGGKYRPIWVLV